MHLKTSANPAGGSREPELLSLARAWRTASDDLIRLAAERRAAVNTEQERGLARELRRANEAVDRTSLALATAATPEALQAVSLEEYARLGLIAPLVLAGEPERAGTPQLDQAVQSSVDSK